MTGAGAPPSSHHVTTRSGRPEPPPDQHTGGGRPSIVVGRPPSRFGLRHLPQICGRLKVCVGTLPLRLVTPPANLPKVEGLCGYPAACSPAWPPPAPETPRAGATGARTPRDGGGAHLAGDWPLIDARPHRRRAHHRRGAGDRHFSPLDRRHRFGWRGVQYLAGALHAAAAHVE